MKRFCLLLLAAMLLLPTMPRAQRRTWERSRGDRPRDLRIMVRDTLGNPLDHLPVFAFPTGRDETILSTTDRSGNRYLRVRESDTLHVYVHDHIFSIEAAGLDSIGITILNPPAVNHIDPVAFYADRMQVLRARPIDMGYGMITPENYPGASALLDGRRAGDYPNLLVFLQGKVAGLQVEIDNEDPANGRVFINRGAISILNAIPEPLLVVDGNTYSGRFAEASRSIPMTEIESVFVIKEGIGLRGAGGIIAVTTRSGARASRP